MKIRPLRREDEEEVIDVCMLAGALQYGERQSELFEFRALLAEGHNRVDVATVGDRVVGAVSIGFTDARDFPDNNVVLVPVAREQLARRVALHGEIRELAVHPEVQGSGIGRALLKHALRVLQLAGVSRVQLLVRGDNASALALYRSFGFSARVLDESDTRLMSLDVNPLRGPVSPSVAAGRDGSVPEL